MDTPAIRRGLYNIKTRAATIDALIEEGHGAAPAVVPLLQDRNDGIRWAAIRVLTDIGDESVFMPLVTLLEQSRNVPDVIRALTSITGQDFGDKTLAWREWALQRQAGGLQVGLLADKALLAAAIKDLPVTLSGEGQDYVVSVSLPDRRIQNIRVDFSGKDTEGHPVVQLTTPCGPAVAEQYEAILKLNMSIPYGSIGLALLDDALCFALIHTCLRATVHPEDIARSIMCLAHHGDTVERMLAPKDTF
jgi:hypothetical protein